MSPTTRRTPIKSRVAFTAQVALFMTVATNDDTPADAAPNNPSQHPALLTINEAAARLRVGRSTAYELIASGQLEVVHIGRSARVPVDAIDQFVQDLRARSNIARARVTRVP